MNTLKRCRECNSELKTNHEDIQFCRVCGYWTKKGTARVDSIMIF